MPEQFRNILIVRTDRIGDVILTTPAVKALRDAYPQAALTMLVSPVTRDLVEANSRLDDIIVDDREEEHRGLGGYLKLISVLRRKKFDCAIVYHTKKRTNLLCYLAGIPVRVGYKNEKFGFLLNRPVVDTRPAGEKHEAQYCLDVLQSIGIASEDTTIYLPVPESSLRWADRFCEQQGIQKDECLIAVHAGASDPAKRWPEDHFAQLIDRVAAKHAAKIVLVGSRAVEDISRSIASIAQAPVIDMTGKTGVGELMGLLMRADLLVSNDSGPVHIAAGVGTPVISIFTRNQPGINPERWKPLCERSRVISVSRSQSSEKSFQKAGPADPQYLGLIGVEQVLEAVDALFKLC